MCSGFGRNHPSSPLSLLQGHKRAASDVSVASTEEEKIPVSPSVLESVPEKAEPLLPVATPTELPVVTPTELPVATPTELPVANHVVDTSFVEEPAAPGAGEHTEECSITPVEGGEVEQKQVEETLPEAGVDVASPGPEAEPEAPAKEMQQLEIAVEDEKEVDTAEVPANTQTSTESSEVTETPQEEKMTVVEESSTPAEEEEDQYKHLKVTLTLPEPDKVLPEEENGEKPTEKDKINAEDEKTVPDKAKDDKERDSDSGSVSAADNSSVDLNLSISSFLSKTKERGSVSIQVTHT